MNNITIIAGNCVIESLDDCLYTASELADIADGFGIRIIYKASFDKANRSDFDSYRGVGLEEGCRILEKVRHDSGLMVTTDVHSVDHVKTVTSVCDVIQIPALLSRQNDLIQAAVNSGKVVNVKIGQFMGIKDVECLSKKIGCGNWLTYRGTSYGGKIMIDFAILDYLVSVYKTVFFDACHSVHRSDLVAGVARAAVDIGVDGLFFEVHRDPKNALCDGKTSVKLDEFEYLLNSVLDGEF